MSKIVRISDKAHTKLAELSGKTGLPLSALASIAIDELHKMGLPIDRVRAYMLAQVDDDMAGIAGWQDTESDELDELMSQLPPPAPEPDDGDDVDLSNLLGGD